MDFKKLITKIHGQVILPGDPTYDEVRQVFYGGINKKPAAIIRVANAQDVKKAVLFAKENEIELAIRSGGHSVAGYCTTDGGIVIDLRDMKKIEIDAASKTMWAGRTRRSYIAELVVVIDTFRCGHLLSSL